MYTRYFGLDEKPFTLTPNPRFIFLSKQHREAFAHLLYGINSHYGFIELVGEVGTGKTTVLRTLLGQLQDGNYRIALIFNPCMNSVELLLNICQEFGIETNGLGINDLLSGLNRFLLEENGKGRTVVLVIDEAQNLQPDVLEQIRLISNLETENDKLIQIILAGQPELERLLQRHNLRQLNQRIAVRFRLGVMDGNETGAYIRHRLDVAGARGGVSFSRLAVRLIHLYSRGAPRMINIICDRALLTAYADGRRTISPVVVLRAINELSGVSRCGFTLAGLASALVVFCLFGLIVGQWLPEVFSSPEPRPTEVVSLPLPPRPSRPGAEALSPGAHSLSVAKAIPFSQEETEPVRRLRVALLNLGLNDTHIGAFNGLMAKWQARPIRIFKGTMSVPATFSELAAKRDLRCTVFQGSLEDALRFDLPFLVCTTVVDRRGRFCIAVTSAKGRLLTVSPALLKGGEVDKNDLAPVASGTFYLLWRDSARIPSHLVPGERRKELHTLQRMLKQAGCYRQAIDGVYSKATISAVRRFQRSQGIPTNDSGGELTLALLSRLDAAQMAPSLGRN
ncbi:ExeA family protein [Pelobacter propionicus]|uniref:Peptidoglycan-binding domain 1 protein n=1 Tax=Pelobacter propionicus (strain DSM 2379 / NBRC 103807 / OttBd1) TaxID=338966 RepID=A1APV8_PELPD|nr:ExeA family protein [Pelobacter propionicus]ABK99378.1 Peptidoglycan-binding domain 1 protein [Pelobacter propionicus DSM 2379]